MYNASAVPDIVGLRPGPVAGCYPEKVDRQERGWLGDACEAWKGRLLRLSAHRYIQAIEKFEVFRVSWE